MAAMKVCWIFGQSARLKSGDGTKNWKTNFRIGFSGRLFHCVGFSSKAHREVCSIQWLGLEVFSCSKLCSNTCRPRQGLRKRIQKHFSCNRQPSSSNDNSTRLPKNFVNTSPQLEKWKAWRDEARLLGDYLAPISRNVRLLGAHFKDSFWRSPLFNLAWGQSNSRKLS